SPDRESWRSGAQAASAMPNAMAMIGAFMIFLLFRLVRFDFDAVRVTAASVDVRQMLPARRCANMSRT
ncbi:hypothetical protein ACX83E_25735, partial [Burkholderia pseudomallei]